LAHASCSIHEVDELLHIDWLDRTMGRNRKCLTILPYKHTVTASTVPPIDTVLLRHGLKLSDLPVERVAPHGDKQLCCRVHGRYDTAGNIARQATEER
ncbi:MAG TPA: hypothetical protein VFI62_12670, partial [Burkholderiales bacterium]|nr:hypothetical protein [Burkholderiales bacterium]